MDAARDADDPRLAVTVARRHYLADESKVDIASSLGISRFKVARLLDLAHAEGTVRIQIVDPHEADDPLAVRVREAFGLQECRVVASDLPEPLLGAELGAAGARLLAAVLTAEDCLGLPWSRTVHRVVDALQGLPPVPVVQLCGSLVLPGEQSAVDLVRQAASVTRGSARVFHAPLIMPTAAGAEALRSQPDVHEALAAADQVTVAVCSIGAWAPGVSTIHDAVAEEARAAVRDAGAVAETMGVFFAADGTVVHPELSDRLITVSANRLRDTRTVVAFSRGVERAGATRAVLRSGVVDRLVIDSDLAHALTQD